MHLPLLAIPFNKKQKPACPKNLFNYVIGSSYHLYLQ